MARIRTIKPEFWADEKLGPLDPTTRLVFLGLISQADDAGRVLDSVRFIDGLLFPFTDDTAGPSLEVLDRVGVVERGMTEGGQPVIQIVGWSAHQRIDKPNLKSALEPVAIRSTTRRRKIPDAVRAAVYERDAGMCQSCGIEVKIGKDDKYDNDPNLAEIDHIIEVADGGTNHPQNLQLLCFSCNRKKAGEAIRRRNQEASGKDRGSVVEASTPGVRPTTYDLRPTSEELRTRAREDPDPVFGSLDDYAVAAIKGLYGWPPDEREGTDERVWNGTALADRPRCIAIAIARLEGEGTAYHGKLFRQTLLSVISEQHESTTNDWADVPLEA